MTYDPGGCQGRLRLDAQHSGNGLAEIAPRRRLARSAAAPDSTPGNRARLRFAEGVRDRDHAVLELGARNIRIDDKKHETSTTRDARRRGDLARLELEHDQLAAISDRLELLRIDAWNSIDTVRATDQARDCWKIVMATRADARDRRSRLGHHETA
jgi:hypothetical protein